MRLLLVSDYTLLREGLRQFLCRLQENIEVLEAASLNQALTKLDRHRNISFLLLCGQSRFDTWEALDTLRGHSNNVPVCLLSESENYSTVRQALAVGAKGVISYNASPHVLAEALRSVLNGNIYLPPESAIQNPKQSPPDSQPNQSPAGGIRLTQRQREVLALIQYGQSNKQIARSLSLAEGTVKIHCMAIFRELGVKNRTQAALRAEQFLG